MPEVSASSLTSDSQTPDRATEQPTPRRAARRFSVPDGDRRTMLDERHAWNNWTNKFKQSRPTTQKHSIPLYRDDPPARFTAGRFAAVRHVLRQTIPRQGVASSNRRRHHPNPGKPLISFSALCFENRRTKGGNSASIHPAETEKPCTKTGQLPRSPTLRDPSSTVSECKETI